MKTNNSSHSLANNAIVRHFRKCFIPWESFCSYTGCWCIELSCSFSSVAIWKISREVVESTLHPVRIKNACHVLLPVSCCHHGLGIVRLLLLRYCVLVLLGVHGNHLVSRLVLHRILDRNSLCHSWWAWVGVRRMWRGRSNTGRIEGQVPRTVEKC